MAEDIDLKGLDTTKVGTAKVGGTLVLSLKESLTFENCEEFETMFNGIIGQNPPALILDFKSATSMDSMALELLIRIHDALKGQGGMLKLTNLNPVCKDILTVTRLINHFHVYEDVADSVRIQS
jgi:anti-anti-sigma factor